ncbi:CAF1 family ribonuclease [Penicillium sp. IBT 16267x]|nr:CAF1 family ribonuclease [Penicillium sp. IBT 16267x]
MDVTAGNFTALLPWILYQISCSSFIAIDLEFSGIAIALSNQAQKDQSLQERYIEKIPPLVRTYKMTPYNINLSPFVDRALDVNRDWTFMSCHGIPNESLIQYGNLVQRYSRTNAIAAVDLKETDKETIDFLQAARRMINWWLAQSNTSRSEYFNIPPHTMPKALKALCPVIPKTLNNMEKRLSLQDAESHNGRGLLDLLQEFITMSIQLLVRRATSFVLPPFLFDK